MIAGLVAYIINFITGRNKNFKLATHWINTHRALLEDNFSLVGKKYFLEQVKLSYIFLVEFSGGNGGERGNRTVSGYVPFPYSPTLPPKGEMQLYKIVRKSILIKGQGACFLNLVFLDPWSLTHLNTLKPLV